MNPKQGRFMNIVMNLLLGSVIGALALVILNNFSLLVFIQNVIAGFFVGYTIGDLVPSLPMGMKFANKLGLKQDSFVGYLCSTAVLALIMVTTISFFSMFVGMGFDRILFPIWWSVYPKVLLPAYFLLLIVLKPMIKFATTHFLSTES